MIIDRNDPPQFNSWIEIFQEVKAKKISCPDVTHIKFVNALRIISIVSHPNLFKVPEFEYIHRLLNQIKHYRNSEHFSFVDDLYGIARLIRLVRRRTPSEQLFNKMIFSNFGMYSQFLITAYVAKKLKIMALEVNNKPYNTDILATLKKKEIHFHVKDIREEKKEEKLLDAVFIIDYILSDRAKARGAKKRLSVSKFIGVPPEGLKTDYWEKFAQSIDEKSQTIKHVIQLGGKLKITKPLELTITFVWHDYSGTFISGSREFNNQLRLDYEFEKLNNTVKNNPPPEEQIHILVAITEDTYNWKVLKKSIKNEHIGLVLVDLGDFVYNRSPFILPNKYQLIEDDLNSIFSESVEFKFN